MINLMVSETVEGYASLLDAVLKLPSEAAPAKEVAEIPSKLKEKFQWQLFKGVSNLTVLQMNKKSFTILDEFEKNWNHTPKRKPGSSFAFNESFIYDVWEEERHTLMSNIKRRREEDEVRLKAAHLQLSIIYNDFVFFSILNFFLLIVFIT